MPLRRPQPAQRLDEVTLQGRIHRFIYRDEVRGFGIAVLVAADSRHTIKGNIWGVERGEQVEVIGRWVDDQRYGRQLQVETLRPLLPVTTKGIAEHLARAGVTGVGKKMAERIAQQFGTDTLAVIRDNPERLREVAGIGAKRADAIASELRQRLVRAETSAFLHGLGLGPAVVRRIYARFGEDAVRVVTKRPYSLAREVVGIGFLTADRVARAQGVAPDAPQRIDAGVLRAMDELAGNGHTAPPRRVVLESAAALLSAPLDRVEEAAQRMVASGALRRCNIREDAEDSLSTRQLHSAESGLADDLLRLNKSHALPMHHEEIALRMQLAAGALGFALQGAQRDAVIAGLQAGLMVITGGPGTGKTTIIQGLLAALQQQADEVALAAPTGRAARRLTETTLRDASTVHRLLEYDPRAQQFQRDRDNPLAAKLVIIDESSMLDVKLAAALCAAIAPGSRLLLVGDADQLPSVGPGAVLGDIIDARTCHVTRLDRIYRQADRSLIVDNAHRVKQGELPVGSKHPEADFFVVGRDTPESIIHTTLDVVCQRLPSRHGYDPIDDIQVLVPVHKGPLGTQAFNQALRASLNPNGRDIGGGLRVGDKVIQVRNNYDLDVQNGDVGRIIGSDAAGVLVRLAGREVTVPAHNLEDLQLAYAITVHKSQGSEYPAVVMPLHGSHRLLLQRNLLYTAITRARKFAVLIGQPSAIAHATRNAAAEHRQTLLRAMLQDGASEGA